MIRKSSAIEFFLFVFESRCNQSPAGMIFAAAALNKTLSSHFPLGCLRLSALDDVAKQKMMTGKAFKSTQWSHLQCLVAAGVHEHLKRVGGRFVIFFCCLKRFHDVSCFTIFLFIFIHLATLPTRKNLLQNGFR